MRTGKQISPPKADRDARYAEIHRVDVVELEDFADKHGLKMVVRERMQQPHPNAKFYACFENVEIKDGIILRSPHGNGATVEEAIKEYATEISKRHLVYRA